MARWVRREPLLARLFIATTVLLMFVIGGSVALSVKLRQDEQLVRSALNAAEEDLKREQTHLRTISETATAAQTEMERAKEVSAQAEQLERETKETLRKLNEEKQKKTELRAQLDAKQHELLSAREP
jgi:transcriptional/translational regulatory protein YebC/TACO1